MHVVTVIEICSPKVRMSWKKKEFIGLDLDCKTVGFFFLKISKEIGNAWRKSLARAKRGSLDCSRVLEYAKIRTVLRSRLDSWPTCSEPEVIQFIWVCCFSANCLMIPISSGLHQYYLMKRIWGTVFPVQVAFSKRECVKISKNIFQCLLCATVNFHLQF